jgi:hypothetical protein
LFEVLAIAPSIDEFVDTGLEKQYREKRRNEKLYQPRSEVGRAHIEHGLF